MHGVLEVPLGFWGIPSVLVGVSGRLILGRSPPFPVKISGLWGGPVGMRVACLLHLHSAFCALGACIVPRLGPGSSIGGSNPPPFFIMARVSTKFLLRPPYTRLWDRIPRVLWDTLADESFSPRQTDGELLVLMCLRQGTEEEGRKLGGEPASPAPGTLGHSGRTRRPSGPDGLLQRPGGRQASPASVRGRHVRCRSRRSRPSSCCTLGRMMRGPWMPTSMPTTRPSRSTFGQWTSGERVEILDRTCWETSHTLQCAPWPWRARSPLWDCRTWRNILRWFPKPGGPPPVGGRAEQTLWGLEDLEPRVMEDTDNDSVLMLREMYLTSLAYQGLGQLTVPQVLEHPMDAMECSRSAARCSSIWVTRAYIQWANALHHSLIKFDECRLGQVVVKSTTLSTDLPLHHWHDLRCNHGAHPRGEKLNSSDLSRYPEQMMQGLAAAILCRAGPVLEALKAGQQALAGLTLGSLPVSASDNPEVRTPTQPAGRTVGLRGETLPLQPWARHCMEISDRPTTLPITHDPNLSDKVMYLQMAFKQRPLRDGGGKPSLGRLAPWTRPLSKAPVSSGSGTRGPTDWGSRTHP